MFDTRPQLSTDNILNRITEYTLFKNYCSNFEEVGVKFKSEFRKESYPSVIITFYNNKLWYKDFGTNEKAMDCFSFIQYKYGLEFKQALIKINEDFKLDLFYDRDENYKVIQTSVINYDSPKLIEKQLETNIRVKQRQWYERDLKFWNQFYINKKLLDYYYVQPIEWFSINNIKIISTAYCYSYYFGKNGDLYYYKIYSPTSKNKWITNAPDKIQGYEQLPQKGNLLVITKSLKDIMVLASFGIPAIAPQTETIIIEKSLDTEIKQRFKNIFILFDNDAQGIKGSQNNVEVNNYTPIFIPEDSNCKDISDFIRMKGPDKTKSLLQILLTPYF